MKIIYVFGYDCYHPKGGFRNFKGRFDSLIVADTFLAAESAQRGGIVNGWEELEILEITEREIRTITTGQSVSEYLHKGPTR